MPAASPVVTSDHAVPPLAERAAAILRDEIRNGALGNIATAHQRWPAVYRDLVAAAASPRAAGVGGLIGDVLDLLAPPSPAGRDGSAPSPPPAAPALPPVPVLTAPRAAPPGGTSVIRAGLQNDGPDAVEVAFAWSDLVAAPDNRIAASRLRLSADRARVRPGEALELTIVLDVPREARAGLYRVVVQTTADLGPCALLTFPVGIMAGAAGPGGA
jgi:hypothetical protein